MYVCACARACACVCVFACVRVMGGADPVVSQWVVHVRSAEFGLLLIPDRVLLGKQEVQELERTEREKPLKID